MHLLKILLCQILSFKSGKFSLLKSVNDKSLSNIPIQTQAQPTRETHLTKKKYFIFKYLIKKNFCLSDENYHRQKLIPPKF